MKILFITSSHNGLSQRAWAELSAKGHVVEIQLATSNEAMISAVSAFKPDLILAPFLKKAIPDSIWKSTTCLIVHPGIKGDRGPSSLDWAVMSQKTEWGVTVLQADEEMDAGDIWSSNNFEMRSISKSNLYRHEVTQAALVGILDAVAKFQSKTFCPEKLDYTKPEVKGTWNDPVKRVDRRIDWNLSTDQIITKINAADSNPGVLEEEILPFPCFMFGAHKEGSLNGDPGLIIAKREEAICIATGDGAIWVSHLKKRGAANFKLPATTVLNDKLSDVLLVPRDVMNDDLSVATFRDIWYEEKENVGYLHFDFYNGAMSTSQCQRLRKAYFNAKARNTDIIVLMGGHDIWSNGIHLNVIENALNPADESWDNIVAIDDFVRDVITTDSHYIISAMRGNAGAGGVIMALAADDIIARKGIILNPHYKKMGLFGSEYWTYLLPKRVGDNKAKELIEDCLPLDTQEALKIGLIDKAVGTSLKEFETALGKRINDIKRTIDMPQFKMAKKKSLMTQEMIKPIDEFRNRELGEMWNNFYSLSSNYHSLRYFFVHKIECGQQPKSIKLDNFKVSEYA
ncbi:MAG: hydrogenase maturation protein [Kordia sp.]|nr:MAG: hydrogenase maturation protein [Kordia sp.]